MKRRAAKLNKTVEELSKEVNAEVVNPERNDVMTETNKSTETTTITVKKYPGAKPLSSFDCAGCSYPHTPAETFYLTTDGKVICQNCAQAEEVLK